MELQQGENNNNNIHKVKEGQRFVDPHFHVWDFESPTNPGGHNLDWLGITLLSSVWLRLAEDGDELTPFLSSRRCI
jgi:hypothetical protein